MIWVIAFLIIGAFCWMAYLAISFHLFKSKLMNAFGKAGISYENANHIYTSFSKDIHALKANGNRPEDIVIFILRKKEEDVIFNLGNLLTTETSHNNNSHDTMKSTPDKKISSKDFFIIKELFDSLETEAPRLTGYGIYVILSAMKKANLTDTGRYLDGIALIGFRYLRGDYDESYIEDLIQSNKDFEIMAKNINEIISEEMKYENFYEYKNKISIKVEEEL